MDRRRQRRLSLALIFQMFVNSSDIIFGSCEFYFAVLHITPSSFTDVSRTQMVGKQSVPRCTARRNPADLGAIGRMVVAVRLVKRAVIGLPMPCLGSSGWAGVSAVPPFTRTTSVPSISGACIACFLGFCVSKEYLRSAILLVPESLCTSDLDPLRRMCPGRDQVCVFHKDVHHHGSFNRSGLI